MDIDEGRLHSLPEDDIPTEINGVIRQNDDAAALERENEGYVPQDEDEG